MPKIVDHGQRRRVIAGAAVDVISTNGLANLTLSDVAQAAGCSTGMVNHYFSNKQALVVAAAREASFRFSDGFFTRPHPAPTGPEHLVELLLAMVPITDGDQPAHRVFVHLYSEGMGDPAVADVARTYLDGAAAHVQRVLEQGQRDGWVRDDIETPTASRVLIAAIDGLGIRSLLNASTSATYPLRAHVELLVELVATGSVVPPAPADRTL